jgi:hypothetical protein
MVNKQHPKRTIVPSSGAQAFAELHDEIAAVRDDLLVPISVDIAHAHQIALAAADRVDELMPQIAMLPTLDIERIRKLRLYAAACQHAHVLATAPDQDPRLPKALAEAVKLRDDLLATAKLLVRFGAVSEERVDTIRTGSGHVEIASSIEQLGVLFEDVWDRVESRIPVTAEMVERAPVLALELHALLGAKKVRPLEKNEASRMRQRAFSLLVKAYEECQSAVEFIRRHEEDAMSFTPSLFAKKRKRGGPVEEEVPVAEETVITTPPPTVVPMTELAPTG